MVAVAVIQPRRSRRALLALVTAAIALAAWQPASADAAARCARADAPGGEWRTYGHDLANSRSQPAEKAIGPTQALALSPAWSFAPTSGESGDMTGTPIVADGCVYVAGSAGWVFALNANSGKLVWQKRLPEGARGPVYGTVAVAGGRVYAAAAGGRKSTHCVRGSCIGPYVVALRQGSGKVDWVSRAIDVQPGADVYGSPVVFDGVLMIGVSGGAAELGDEADRYAFQGSMSFLDARTGRILRKTWSIHPPNKPKDDYAGAGIWSTPAVDRRAKFAYVGAGNPFRPQAEHAHADAVLKFDVDRSHRSFGKIVASHKGNIDEYIPQFSQLPCTDIPGNPPPWYPQGLGSCGDIDLDFGASPNLFRSGGRKLVGAGQKSGVYHVFDARTMKPVWSQVVGPPTPVGGIIGSTAYDGSAIYGPVTLPGYLWSISAAGGSQRWIGPIADGVHWGPPVAIANGIVYTVDFAGFLDAFDAGTGAPVGKASLVVATGSPPSLSWGGVSVARDTVYATVGLGRTAEEGGGLVAFRPRQVR
jgi:polyvinyl alcohol dehydrogenase (cytochrome)